MEAKEYNEAWLKGHEAGYLNGYLKGKRAAFFKPLIHYILIGFMIALTVIFGIASFISIIWLSEDTVAGLIALFISGLSTGITAAISVYLYGKR